MAGRQDGKVMMAGMQDGKVSTTYLSVVGNCRVMWVMSGKSRAETAEITAEASASAPPEGTSQVTHTLEVHVCCECVSSLA